MVDYLHSWLVNWDNYFSSEFGSSSRYVSDVNCRLPLHLKNYIALLQRAITPPNGFDVNNLYVQRFFISLRKALDILPNLLTKHPLYPNTALEFIDIYYLCFHCFDLFTLELKDDPYVEIDYQRKKYYDCLRYWGVYNEVEVVVPGESNETLDGKIDLTMNESNGIEGILNEEEDEVLDRTDGITDSVEKLDVNSTTTSDEDFDVNARSFVVEELEIKGEEYIEAENRRLEREPYQFSLKEIIIRIEYKYCPNSTIIDTPGVIAPARARNNRSLQNQAGAAESLVHAKMQQKEFIILCLEDCSDWSNATTRRVVKQIDPEISKTVVVSTKLDTNISQFERASDMEVFLSVPASTLDGFMLGDSLFFTSVPSGRVGPGHESVFRSNDEFKQTIHLREIEDISALKEKLGRPLSKQERSRIGVSSLKLFLEELLQRRYMDSVPLIIPLLEKEYWSSSKKMNEIHQEVGTLD